MRPYAPTYRGDATMQLGGVPGMDRGSGCNAAISRTHFVRSNMRAESEPKAGVHVGIRRHERVQSLND